jgi:hypothetical protein
MKPSEPDERDKIGMDRSQFIKLTTLMAAYPFLGTASILQPIGGNQKNKLL